MTAIRQRMLDAMVLHGLAARTQESCLCNVEQLARHYHRSPDCLSDEQVQAYLLHLLQERHLSRSSVNQVSCSVRFLVCDVLGQSGRCRSEDASGAAAAATAGRRCRRYAAHCARSGPLGRPRQLA